MIGSALLAGVVLVILARADALAGPALIGSTAAVESLIMIAAGTLIGSGLLRRGGSSPTRGLESLALESVRGSGGGRTDEKCDVMPRDGTR